MTTQLNLLRLFAHINIITRRNTHSYQSFQPTTTGSLSRVTLQQRGWLLPCPCPPPDHWAHRLDRGCHRRSTPRDEFAPGNPLPVAEKTISISAAMFISLTHWPWSWHPDRFTLTPQQPWWRQELNRVPESNQCQEIRQFLTAGGHPGPTHVEKHPIGGIKATPRL